ncbi:MAG: hypothetical protein IAE80_14575 [Anaerolinea sp.]|nr:hypothetical protein [Anaerolinea sp.]
MVTITLELDREIEREARIRGLLSGEKLAQMITEELQEQMRKEAIEQTRLILQQLDALEPKWTEEEIAEELRKPSKNP